MAAHAEPFPPLDARLEQLIHDHIGVVHHVAHKITPPHPYDHDDLADVGLEELVRAARDYDPTRGISFAPFAAQRIHWRILDWKRQNCWGYSRQAGRSVPPPISLEVSSHSNDEPGGTRILDHLAAPPDRYDTGDRDRLLARLSPRQRFIVLARERGMSQEEIGRLLGCCGSRVSQIQTAARIRLRQSGIAA